MTAGRDLRRYARLFAVEVRHDFFESGVCPRVSLRETAASARRMHNLGLLRRDFEGGMAVFGDGTAAGEAVTLEFALDTTDRAFGQYTDLDGIGAGAVLGFDSAAAAAALPDGAIPLQKGGVVTAADVIEPADGGWEIPSPPPLGLVRIHATVPAGGTGVEAGPRHLIVFRARSRFWKYYVLGREEADPPPSIRDDDEQVEFELTGPALLPGNRRAVTLRSKAPIALRDRPAQRFQLRVKTPVGERVLVKRLAVASPHLLGKETIDGSVVTVSEIYVNL